MKTRQLCVSMVVSTCVLMASFFTVANEAVIPSAALAVVEAEPVVPTHEDVETFISICDLIPVCIGRSTSTAIQPA